MADDYAAPHAPAMTKSERDARIAEVSREQGTQQVRDWCEGAAAYRAALLREYGGLRNRTELAVVDEIFRKRFGEDFDREVRARDA